ncbi:MAG: beta-carotene 15,15'-monooxygenase [Firmicutes bacterium]|nr:beta-carotene 15,15'-monooxygenase [Clostridiales bacterium]MBQ5954664.1 beta-carotene 15,15'-monooxygenase [Bacillota bacterium]MBQ6089380.1 beta-carotene 15,15'-monooxygenase [Bacillota bacterium]MBR3184384.1 beta-carotene 15,15'-monooxygenase [Bacillota bacterium]MBR3375497.1 beta-carotene 15,15'-monooxygenase [Bacillota bacterium]
MTQENRRNIIILIFCIILALISFFIIAPKMSDPATFSKTIDSLDAKKTTVAELTAASTGAAAAITLLPNDIGTPIAEKLVDLSGYFILIFSAIYMEKFLTTIAGFIAFRYLIPVALLGLGVNCFFGFEMIKRFGIRLIAFALILVLLVPASVGVSNLIEQTHEYSIQQTIDEANTATDEINENNDTENANALQEFFNKVKGGVEGQLKKFENILSNFIDAVAVLIVTTCVIPILVLLILLMLVRQFFGAMGSAPEDIKKLKETKNAIIKK